jgi:hypothetical protein
MQNLSHKSIYSLYKSCRFWHKEYNKIGFAIFGFLYDFIWFLQATAKTHEGGKILFTTKPSERLGGSQPYP